MAARGAPGNRAAVYSLLAGGLCSIRGALSTAQSPSWKPAEIVSASTPASLPRGSAKTTTAIIVLAPDQLSNGALVAYAMADDDGPGPLLFDNAADSIHAVRREFAKFERAALEVSKSSLGRFKREQTSAWSKPSGPGTSA